MKHLLFVLFGIILSASPLIAQDSIQQDTHTVVTADGTKTVSSEKQNQDITNRLKQLKEQKEDERDDKRNKKFILKIISRIGFVAIIIGIAAWWRSRENKVK